MRARNEIYFLKNLIFIAFAQGFISVCRLCPVSKQETVFFIYSVASYVPWPCYVCIAFIQLCYIVHLFVNTFHAHTHTHTKGDTLLEIELFAVLPIIYFCRLSNTKFSWALISHNWLCINNNYPYFELSKWWNGGKQNINSRCKKRKTSTGDYVNEKPIHFLVWTRQVWKMIVGGHKQILALLFSSSSSKQKHHLDGHFCRAYFLDTAAAAVFIW